jgi:hypothetical protein
MELRPVESVRWWHYWIFGFKRTRCQICHEVLFVGKEGVNPMTIYMAKGLGWPDNQPPIAVRCGGWRSLFRETWYHQKCCGVYHDRAGGSKLNDWWYVFGYHPHQAEGQELDQLDT